MTINPLSQKLISLVRTLSNLIVFMIDLYKIIRSTAKRLSQILIVLLYVIML